MPQSSSPFLYGQAPVCPDDLLEKAKAAATPRVAIAHAGAALPMEAAKQAFEEGIFIPLFVGDTGDIKAQAERLNWDISTFEIIPTRGEDEAGLAAAVACGRGEADVLMKGQLHTDVFVKVALSKEAGLRTGERLVHIFHVSPPNGGRPLLISDAAVNVAPTLEVRKSATKTVVELLHNLGVSHPKIAFLSATESPIPSVPSAEEGRELADWARANIDGAVFSGPLALDLILSAKAAELKGVADDPVTGQADAVIVPEIVSGNVLFKSLVYLGGGCAAGIVLGAKVPLLLTSRADPAAARLASIALAAVVAATKNPPD